MTPEPKPSRIPVEDRTMLIGKPTPVLKVTTDAISKAVIAVITEVSLIVETARRLNCFASFSYFSTSFRKKVSASSIFLRRYVSLSVSISALGIWG